jgi:hypothetical protein
MNRDTFAPYIPLVKLLFVGVLVGSLIPGLSLNAVALTLLLAALLVLARADVLKAVIVIALGAVIVVLFPVFSFTALDPVAALACAVLMILL